MDEIPVFIQKRVEFEPHEEIFLIRRKHWFVFRDSVLLAVFAPFLFLFGSFILSNTQFSLPLFLSKTAAQWCLYAIPLVFVVGCLMFIWKMYFWQRTFYIVTNRRIIIMRQNTLFSCDVHQMSLDKTQDVILKVKGLQAALYGFGDVSIQASSTTAQLVFETVGKPHEVQRKVMAAADKYQQQLPETQKIETGSINR